LVFETVSEGFEIPRKINLTACVKIRSIDPCFEYGNLLSSHYSDQRDWKSILEVAEWKPSHVSWFAGVGLAQHESEWWLLRNELPDGKLLNHLVLVTKSPKTGDPDRTMALVNKLNDLLIANGLVVVDGGSTPLVYMGRLNDLIDREMTWP